MTIIFLSPSFYPQIGGVEKHAFEIAKRLNKKHKVIVITEGGKNSHEITKGLEIYRFYFGVNNKFKKFRIWKKLLQKRKLFFKADIIHCHDVFFWYLPIRLIFPRKRVFTTFHGYEVRYPPEFKALFIRKLSEKLSLGNICVGDYIEKWYGTKPTFITYGGVDKVHNKNKRNKNYKHRLKILFIGRIEEDTGVPIYYEVLKRLKKYEFIVCGDGSQRHKFEKFGKVLGFVRNMDNVIEKSDIVFSSSYLSILTALSFKKTVFSVYQNPLKRDYLKMAPFSKWIFISDNAGDLVRKMDRNEKERHIKTENGYNWVRKQTWDDILKIYLRLYGL